jgi:ribose transport system permease protein
MQEGRRSTVGSTAAEAQPAAVRSSRTAGSALWRQLYNYLLLLVLLATIALFSVLRPTTFPTVANLASILVGGAPLVLISLAVVLPLIVNQFDLTPGYVASLAGVLVAGFLAFSRLPIPVAIALALGFSVAVGVINGALVAYGRLNSLIVTLGTGSIMFGVSQLYSKGITIFQGIPREFTLIGQTRVFGIPLPVIYVAIIAIVIWYILEYRAVGRRLYAIGGSEEAARLLGIRVDRLTLAVFVASALLAGLAGVIETTRVGSANPTGQTGQLLPAFTAAFLGATSIRPGLYNVWGTIIAVYLVRTATTGLFMLGAPAFTADIFNGAILLIAIALAKLSSRRLAETG